MSEDEPPEAEAVAIPNAADAKGIRRQRDTAKRRQEEALAFWRGVFADKVGRREMWGILSAGHAFDERFVAGPNGFPQPEATWCQAGEQRLAFRLYLSWMGFDPDGVALMLRDNEPGLAGAKKR